MKKCDLLFSAYWRNKVGCCEWCGRRDMRLELAHIVSRSVRKLRYDRDNCLVLCSGCHRKAHSNPPLFTELVTRKKGKDILLYLIKASQTLVPLTIKWYEKQLKKIQHLTNNEI